MGTLMSDKLKLDEQETRTMGYSGVSGMLAAFITSPFSGALLGLESAQGGTGGKATYFWVLFPSLLSSAVATVVFVLLSGTFFDTLYRFPQYAPRLADLIYAAPLGLVGGAVGLLFMFSLRRLQRLFQPMKGHVVLRGLLGGLAMGIIGALLPLTLFSGEEQTADLILHAAEIGIVMLIVLAVAKLFAASLLLTTGWKGGYIFPIMFSGVALGPGSESPIPRHPGCSRRCRDDGRCARRGTAGAAVRSALHDDARAEGDRGRDCRCGSCQRPADRVADVARCPARRRTGGTCPCARLARRQVDNHRHNCFQCARATIRVQSAACPQHHGLERVPGWDRDHHQGGCAAETAKAEVNDVRMPRSPIGYF